MKMCYSQVITFQNYKANNDQEFYKISLKCSVIVFENDFDTYNRNRNKKVMRVLRKHLPGVLLVSSWKRLRNKLIKTNV